MNALQRANKAMNDFYKAQDAMFVARAALAESSSQFTIGSTITMPDDHPDWPGSLATVQSKLVYPSEHGFTWFIGVTVHTGSTYTPTYFFSTPFVEETP